ncbi:MAG: NAD(+) synthase [Flavobacteriales bacterium]
MNVEKVTQHIVNWLTNYVKDSHTKGFVIGISGGIDSAVTSTLAAKTGFPVVCVEMPIHQDKTQEERGLNHIKFLEKNYSNASSVRVDLTSVFDSFKVAVQTSQESDLQNLAQANTRSRIRMTLLYYVAQMNNSLVLGTGNKVEDFGIGFYTKYGDGGVDLSPIADLYKTEVYALGKHLNVIEEILTAPPTDGLFGDGRTDEDQIGASYPELEWAMKLVEENNYDLKKFTEREAKVFDIYTRLNRINQHKMKPIPVCVIPKNLTQ